MRVVNPYYPATASRLLYLCTPVRARRPHPSPRAHAGSLCCSPLELVALCRPALLQRRGCYRRLCLVSRGTTPTPPWPPTAPGTLCTRSGTVGQASEREREALRRQRRRCEGVRNVWQSSAVVGSCRRRASASTAAQPSDRHCLTWVLVDLLPSCLYTLYALYACLRPDCRSCTLTVAPATTAARHTPHAAPPIAHSRKLTLPPSTPRRIHTTLASYRTTFLPGAFCTQSAIVHCALHAPQPLAYMR